ncbi:LCP family protein [Streptomyces sp. NPDC048606]|uniref:LCP family protein n=1 Tax=Streptomyces sp. NPDC048606 TaxID=3154726 RepID=UPI00342165C2
MRRLTLALALASSLALGSWSAPYALSADGATPRSASGRGTNILVVGIDSRTGLSAAEKRRLNVGGKGCDCTDVMMLVHLSADLRRASVVSIPRDSYVAYAVETQPAPKGKINGAYALGRGPLTVATVEKVTGLRVDHYLETGFTGFEQAVNGLGGAVVCTDKALKDENSGLDLAAGRHHVDGRGALRYVRARHVERPGDLGRVRRQQRAVSDLLTRLRSDRVLTDPISTYDAARTLLKSVRTDARTSVWDLVRLGTALGRLSPSRTEFVTVPISEFDRRVPGVGSTLIWHDERARALWTALAEDRPVKGDTLVQPRPANLVPNNPASVKVRVDAARVAEALRAAGFAASDESAAAPAIRRPGPPVIRHAPGQEDDASTLATALPGALREAVPGHGAALDVLVGTDPVTVRPVTYDRNIVDGAAVTGDSLGCLGADRVGVDRAGAYRAGADRAGDAGVG